MNANERQWIWKDEVFAMAGAAMEASNEFGTIRVYSRPLADEKKGILRILDNHGNADDLIAFMAERFLPVDEIQASALADEIIATRPAVGYLTISNALQWRLQYSRVIEQAGSVPGVERLT